MKVNYPVVRSDAVGGAGRSRGRLFSKGSSPRGTLRLPGTDRRHPRSGNDAGPAVSFRASTGRGGPGGAPHHCPLGGSDGSEPRRSQAGTDPLDHGAGWSASLHRHLRREHPRQGLERLVRGIPPIRPRRGPRRRRSAKLHGDKGYDYDHLRRWFRSRNITPRIARKARRVLPAAGASPLDRGADGGLAGRLPPFTPSAMSARRSISWPSPGSSPP